jgi:hypothetical protein
LEGFDNWIGGQHVGGYGDVVERLGTWRRDPLTRFDFDSPAYQNMVFFHPFMRRAFFDVQSVNSPRGEGLLHCYVLPIPDGAKLRFEACDVRGRSASVEVTDLRLFMFANGMGILSFGIEAFDLPIADILWINESMRKVYPSSKKQVQEGRTPCDLILVLEQGETRTMIVVEKNLSRHAEMKGVLPPLARTITTALYFLDYDNENSNLFLMSVW